jgi:hypothetical protein
MMDHGAKGDRPASEAVLGASAGAPSAREAKFDNILRPQHYIGRRFEAWQIAEDWSLGFHLGNVLKYVIRCDHKGARTQDLEKALAYLRRVGDQAEIMRHLRTVKAPAHTISAGAVGADYELTAALCYALHHICQASLATDAAAARKHVVLAAQHIKTELGLDVTEGFEHAAGH